MKKVFTLFIFTISCLSIHFSAYAQESSAADACLQKGKARIDEQKYEIALIQLYRAISLNDSLAEAYYYQGLALEKLQSYKLAKPAYEKACELSGNDEYCLKIVEMTSLQTQAPQQKKWPLDRTICFMSLFSTDYKKMEGAHKQVTKDKKFMPDISSTSSDLGQIKNVDCLLLNEMEPVLAETLDTLQVSSISAVIAGTRGYYIFQKLFDGSNTLVDKRPWEPVLAAIRDSLGIKLPEIAEGDSAATAQTSDDQGSRRSRRRSQSDGEQDAEANDEKPVSRVQRDNPVPPNEANPERQGEILPEGQLQPEQPGNVTMSRDFYEKPTNMPFDVPPKAIIKVEPVYPENGGGLEGKIVLQLLIDADGTVINTVVMMNFDPTGNHGFAEAAIEAARQWKFEPALWQDKPTAVWILQEFRFSTPER